MNISNSFRAVGRALAVLGILVLPGRSMAEVTAFVGAKLIDGTGAAPIESGALVVREVRILAVGKAGQVRLPEGAKRVDVSGKVIIPGLINGHGHIGGTVGLQGNRYSRENVQRDLRLNGRYGVTTVVSLGGDEKASVEIRETENTPTLKRARLRVAGPVVVGKDPEEAMIRVDGNVQLGVDYIAHSIRDRVVDDAFIAQAKAADVYYCPTLMRDVSTYIYESEPEFFADPLFLAEMSLGILDQLRDPKRQASIRANQRAQANKEALRVALVNLKKLADAGVPVVMGTDGGPPGRFQGYFEHLEMEMMVEQAGLSPMQVIVSATGGAADALKLPDVGTLEPGKWADFLVLAEDPLVNIANTRSFESVWIAGNQVP